MMRYGYGMGAGMWVVWILVLAVIALVVYLVVRASVQDVHRRQPADGALRRVTRRAAPAVARSDDQVHHERDDGEHKDPHHPHPCSHSVPVTHHDLLPSVIVSSTVAAPSGASRVGTMKSS